MANRPILFSAPMVRALLNGRKTQTRRILKALPNRTIFFDPQKAGLNQFQSPRIKTGDRLYVREHWRTTWQWDDVPPRNVSPDAVVTFEADGSGVSGKHRQAMHMPKWASRITLLVEGVKIERLQDISEDDAKAEGAEKAYYDDLSAALPEEEYRAGYARLWESINAPGSWAANPWVVVYTFTVHHGNIDQIGGEA